MGKKILICCVMALLMAAAADPRGRVAEGDPLASPTPQPTQRVAAPLISGVNPQVRLPEGDLGDINPSGGPFPHGLFLPAGADPPPFVDLLPPVMEDPPGGLAEDVSCGPAALAEALQILDADSGRQAPNARQLEAFLRDRGLIYPWGTGVEELVYAARSHGFPGTQAVYNLSLEALIKALERGAPLVVPLGVNGPDQPGHFVVLTGVSADGEWITCSDPSRGATQLSLEEFSSLWEMQGRAGVAFSDYPLPASADPALPWMGILSALSVLGLMLKGPGSQDLAEWYRRVRGKLADPRRKGIGGGIVPPEQQLAAWIPGTGTEQSSPGSGTIRVEVPIYEPRLVQVGLRGVKREVPVYETRRVQVGYKKETRQVPTYKMVKVYCGTRLVDKKVKVTRYRTKKVWVWKKVTSRAPATRRPGSDRIVLGETQTRWKRVQVSKQVPYQATKIIKVEEPVYEMKKVQSGTRAVTCWVPKYEQRQVLAGYKTVEQTVPIYETRRVQVGTREELRPIQDAAEAASQQDQGGQLSAEDLRLIDKLSRVDPTDAELAALLADGAVSGEDQAEADLSDNRIYQVIIFFRNLRARIGELAKKLGAPDDSADPAHLVSLSVREEEPLDLLNGESVVVKTFQQPWFLDLLFIRQELSIGPEVVTTLHPDGLMDYNLSSQTWSMKLGKTTLFSTLDGETGFARDLKISGERYEQRLAKHSFRYDADGITYKMKIEGLVLDGERSTDQVEVKTIKTLKCQVITIRTLGILVGVLAGVLLASFLYFYLQSGGLVPLPI